MQKTAQGLCDIIKKEKVSTSVIVGYDKRFLSDQFAKWFVEVLAGNNVNAKLTTTPVPTPMVMFGTMTEGNDFGVMITASHNPYEYNGIKIFLKEGRDADVEFTNRLEKVANSAKKIKTLNFSDAIAFGKVAYIDNQKEYINNIAKFLTKKKVANNSNVLFDAMCGVSGPAMKILAKKLNIKNFKLINLEHDAFFKFRMPSPNEDTLKDFMQEVKKGYDFGLASDADGDRLALIDNKGNFYNCNLIMAIVYYYLVKFRAYSGDIVRNLASSVILDKLADKFGSVCHEVPVGFKYVSARMKETNALIGGESSGGLTARGYINGKDSLFASAILLEAQSVIGKPMFDIVQDVKKFAGYDFIFEEIAYVVKNKNALINSLKKTRPDFAPKIVKVSDIDGFKYYFENDQWALIRFSGTEPVLRVFAECENSEVASLVLASIEQYIKEHDC